MTLRFFLKAALRSIIRVLGYYGHCAYGFYVPLPERSSDRYRLNDAKSACADGSPMVFSETIGDEIEELLNTRTAVWLIKAHPMHLRAAGAPDAMLELEASYLLPPYAG